MGGVVEGCGGRNLWRKRCQRRKKGREEERKRGGVKGRTEIKETQRDKA